MAKIVREATGQMSNPPMRAQSSGVVSMAVTASSERDSDVAAGREGSDAEQDSDSLCEPIGRQASHEQNLCELPSRGGPGDSPSASAGGPGEVSPPGLAVGMAALATPIAC